MLKGKNDDFEMFVANAVQVSQCDGKHHAKLQGK